MSTLMQASNQWATRPDDQRYTSLIDLNDAVKRMRQNSSGKVIASRALEVVPVEDNVEGLQVQGPNGQAANLTHWSFGQLAQRAGAPAGYLRTLPGALAADNINYGLHINRDVEDVGVLLYKNNGGAPELRAVTGPGYGRVWNSTITEGLVKRFGDGINGPFRVPGEFGKRVEVTKANTTLYASDRDFFIFLANEENRIEVPNRRDGKAGGMARGFFVWNSEVGYTSFGVSTFLFDYVCCNRIVWGAEGVEEIRIRHTASAPHRWIEEVAPAIEVYAKSSTTSVAKAIANAKANKVDRIEDFLRKRFTAKQASGIMAAHLSDEQRPIETLWDMSVGISAYARSIPHQDDRVKLEREAGAMLKLAA